MSLIDSIINRMFANFSMESGVLVGSLSWVAAVAAVSGGTLAISLLRARSARKAAEAAYTASGHGSILVDPRGRVLETNGPARRLL